MVVPNNYLKKANLPLSSRKAAVVQDNMVNEEKKKSVEKKNTFCARVCVCVWVYAVCYFLRKKKRGIERGGCKDGFINFKYY